MTTRQLKINFSDFFDVAPETISDHGAFNISLINGLTLSKKKEIVLIDAIPHKPSASKA
jgi:hypothetical protein